MIDPSSRYHGLPVLTITAQDGRTISYVARRFLPRGSSLPLLAETAVEQGERIDTIANRTLGDPLAYWRVCDANDAVDPGELVEETGRILRIPLPQTQDG
jgi:hypothetical protein